MRRRFDPESPELMDRAHLDRSALEAALLNLEKLNRYFGSYRLIRKFLSAWLRPGRPYRLVDLATGYGDIPRMIVDWARQRDIAVRIDAVDTHPLTLEFARGASSDYPEIEFVRADVREYAAPVTYDVALCTLALHHFSEDDAVRVLRRALELSHDRVLVSDLERSALARAGVWLVTTCVFREPMTRHDGRISVERAFSFFELESLAREAGWECFSHRRFLPARHAIWTSAERVYPIVDVAEPAPRFA